MKSNLSNNISKFRKEFSLTQEQLADALNVTFASVSKWERGVATPELSLLLRMAELFRVSLDVLVGHDLTGAGLDTMVEQIRELRREKRYDEAIAQAEKALLRFPNDFNLVYSCCELYELAGLEMGVKRYFRRCIDLLEHSILLLPDNKAPEISEVSVRNKIAECQISVGNHEMGLELLKQNNVCGVNNAKIAFTYASEDMYEPSEAEPYLLKAMGDVYVSLIKTMLAYANYYYKTGALEMSRDVLVWLTECLSSMKQDQDAPAFVDKVNASCLAECGNLSVLLGEESAAEVFLRRAYDTAVMYDAAPNCKVTNLRFCIGNTEQASVYDDFGESGLSTVERRIAEASNEKLSILWNRFLRSSVDRES